MKIQFLKILSYLNMGWTIWKRKIKKGKKSCKNKVGLIIYIYV